MEREIKELRGHSGSIVKLMENDGRVFVRKINNVERNIERMFALEREFVPLPNIYDCGKDFLDMEYIHGLDMKSYLLSGRPHLAIADFIIKTISKFRKKETLKNYGGVYEDTLCWINSANDLPFTKEQLIQRLEFDFVSSPYHGDMTLENIIFEEDRGFHFIDPVTVAYDSWVFDLAKLRQDLVCKWFLRHTDLNLDAKLLDIKNVIFEEFGHFYPETEYVLILMLLRVYLHSPDGTFERKFIVREINRLWK